jgi:ribose/xylose/arabinose/galactoside ABC-type transport system permease subunit
MSLQSRLITPIVTQVLPVRIPGISREVGLVILNLVIFAAIAIGKPQAFLSWINFKAILSLMTYDLLLALGMTVVLIIRGLDLSIGASFALLTVVMALALQASVPVPAALLIGLAAAVGIGSLNGYLAVRFGILPFLVTLATMTLARGTATVMTSGQYVSFTGAPAWFLQFGRLEIPLWRTSERLYGLPLALLIVFFVTFGFAFLLRRWVPLRQFFFVGENREAALLSGLRVNLITISGYVICAAFVWLAAVFMLANARIGYANYGVGAEMRALAAAVVGGASMSGGTGSILGTTLGVLMIALIGNGFVLFNGDPSWQQAAIGIILIVAVGVDALRSYRGRG